MSLKIIKKIKSFFKNVSKKTFEPVKGGFKQNSTK